MMLGNSSRKANGRFFSMNAERPRSGEESEDLLEILCKGMFFSDFIVRNPTYKKPKGKEIEIADLLVPLGEELLAIQVKSRYEPEPASERDDIEFKRITKTIESGVSQVKTIKRAIQHGWIKKLKTVRGLEIEVDPDSIRSVIGIVIVDLVGEELYPRSERTQLYASYTESEEIPIHVFLADEFLTISRELDTLADFLRFLKKIRELYKRGLFVIPPDTLDFLAFYKMDPNKVDNILESGTNLFLEEGIWESYLLDHADSIARRDELNKPSYLIDAVIDYLHTSVGYDVTPEWIKDRGQHGQGTVASYLEIARELATIPRINRRILGERFMRCLKDSMIKGQAFSIVVSEDDKTGYLILAQSGDRSKRQEFLYSLVAMAYCYLGLKKIIAIGTEPLHGEGRSYDVYVLANVEFENAEELSEQAIEFFGQPYKHTGTEYTKGKHTVG
jgi:hypothetical protein